MCKPLSEIMLKSDDEDDIFLTSVHEKYSARPEQLESMCLAEFATTYRSVGKSKSADDDDDHLHDDEDDDNNDFSREPAQLLNCRMVLE